MEENNFTETLEDRIDKRTKEDKVLREAQRALLIVSELDIRSFPNHFVATVGYLTLESHHTNQELLRLYEAKAKEGEENDQS